MSATDLVGEGSNRLGQTTAIQPDPDGRPWEARVALDDDGAGDGWYLDPEPLDNAEFTSLDNRFSAKESATTSLTDLYSVTLHEIGHAVGLSGDPTLRIHNQGLLTDIGEDPDHDGERLLLFDGPTTTAVLTTYGVLHISEPYHGADL